MKDVDPIEFFEKNDRVFITGAGGVGKSYAINQFCERYKKEEVLRTASTWKAAEIIGGKTVYSAFMIDYTKTEQEDRKSTRLNSSHEPRSRMPSSA